MSFYWKDTPFDENCSSFSVAFSLSFYHYFTLYNGSRTLEFNLLWPIVGNSNSQIASGGEKCFVWVLKFCWAPAGLSQQGLSPIFSKLSSLGVGGGWLKWKTTMEQGGHSRPAPNPLPFLGLQSTWTWPWGQHSHVLVAPELRFAALNFKAVT